MHAALENARLDVCDNSKYVGGPIATNDINITIYPTPLPENSVQTCIHSFGRYICLANDRVRLLELIRPPVIIGTVTSIAVCLSPALASIQRVRLPTVFHVPAAPRARSAPTQTCVLQPRSCCLGCASAYSLATSHAMLDRGSMLILLVLYFCYLLRGTLSSDFQAGIAP